MRKRIPQAIGTLAAIVLCAGVGASLGLAADGVKTKVKITEGGPDRFEGTVTSEEPKCEKGRKVKLLYRFGGPYKDDVVGTTKTDADGKWSIKGSFQAGLYSAEAKKKEKGDVTCRKGKSKRKKY